VKMLGPSVHETSMKKPAGISIVSLFHPENIVGNAPNERYDFVVRCLIHFSVLFLNLNVAD
jgi:hypothetical protein